MEPGWWAVLAEPDWWAVPKWKAVPIAASKAYPAEYALGLLLTEEELRAGARA